MGKQMDAPVVEYAYPYEIVVIPCENHTYFQDGTPSKRYKARLVINFRLQGAGRENENIETYGESIILVEKETPPTQDDIDLVFIEKKNELIAKVRKEKADYPATPVVEEPTIP